MKKNKLLYLVIILIIVVIVTTIAAFRSILKSNDEIKAEIPTIKFTYKEPDYKLSSTKMTDEEGKLQENYYEFSISSNTANNMKLKYYIFAEEQEGNNIDTKYMKIYLTDENNKPVGRFKNENNSLYLDSQNNNEENLVNLIDKMCLQFKNGSMYDCENQIKINSEIKYRLRYWISDEFEIMPTTTTNGNEHTVESKEYIYKFKVNVLVSET